VPDSLQGKVDRYHRQMLLPGFGPEGQSRLQGATVAVLGCGALGCVVADALARAGVGRLHLVDRDFIELTNLQRQLLYDEGDVAAGLPKAEAARRRLQEINSTVACEAIVDDINPGSIGQIAEGADLLVDGLDNFDTRYLVNDYAVRNGLPYVYGGAVGTSGMAYVVLPKSIDGSSAWETLPAGSRATPCLRCLFPEAPPPGESATCDTAGVLGPVVGIIGNFQAAEALKILSGNFDRVSRSLFNLDLWTNTAMHLSLEAGESAVLCPCCGRRDFESLEGRAGSTAAVLCGRDAVQLRHRQDAAGVDLDALERKLRAHGTANANAFMLRAELQEGGTSYQLTVFPDGRAIIKGTADIATARGLYAKFVGH
jgi:molybdopterin/thiamine biosynthesis adenylyltransferase